jgi:hypothetical protein
MNKEQFYETMATMNPKDSFTVLHSTWLECFKYIFKIENKRIMNNYFKEN